MRKILWLILLSLLCGYAIDKRDRAFVDSGVMRKERFFTIIVVISLSVFAGLRTWYNDTITYIQIFEQAPMVSDFWNSSDARISSGLGFGLLNSIMKTAGFHKQDFFMFYSFMTIVPCVLFIRKYSKNNLLSLFLLFTTGYYVFCLAALKQVVATGICLVSLDFAISKKWVKFFIAVTVAILFHPYSVIYLVVPLMFFKPMTKRTWFYVVVFILAGFMLENLLGIVLNVTDMIGANYNDTTFLGEGVNLFRVVVAAVPFILGIIFKDKLFDSSSREDYLFFNLSMISSLIMFVGIFGTANYFARLGNYFLPIQMIVIPWIISKLHYSDKKWINIGCVVGYFIYFYYESVLLRNFDINFDAIRLGEYLKNIL